MRIKHVWQTNAETRVQEFVEIMRNAKLLIIFPCVHVYQAMLEIHLAIVK